MLVLFAFSYKISKAQNLRISKELYSIQKSNNNDLKHIYDIEEDKNGYIYLATDKGVFKFDGFQFNLLNKKLNSYKEGSCIKFDDKGTLFYENFDGYIFSYQSDNKNWTTYNNFKPARFLNYGLFKNHLSIFSRAGVIIYDLNKKKQSRIIPFKEAYPQYTTQTKDNYYAVNNDKVFMFDEKKIVKEYKIDRKNDEIIIHHLNTDGNHIFLVPRNEYQRGIKVLSKNLDYLYTVYINDIKGVINNIKIINNKVWILTTNGALVYLQNKNKWKLENIHFKDINISDVIKGSTGQLWLSTLGQGLFLIPNDKQFIYAVENEKLTQIILTQENYIIGTSNGKILKTDKKINQAQIISQNKYLSPVTYLYQHPNTDEIFYVSGLGFNYIESNKNLYFSKALKEVCHIDEDFYALATSSNLILFKSNKFKNKSPWINLFNKKKTNEKWSPVLTSVKTKSVAYHKLENKIYYLTNLGLFNIDIYGNNQEILFNKKSIIAEKIKYLNGKIYLLNYDGSIIVYEKEKLNNLLNENKNIIDFKIINQKLILKTKTSFTEIKPDDNSFIKLQSDVQISSINDFTINEEGNLMIVTSNGIIQLPKQISKENRDLNKFIISEIYVNGEEKSVKDLKKLDYNQNNIQIIFAYLDFNYPNLPKIAYKVNNSKWEDIPNDIQDLQFHQLAPGNYSIDFKIDNEIIPKKIEFNISAPFWQTWFFFLLLSVISVFLIAIYFNNKRKTLKKHIVLLEQKVELEKELSKTTLKSIKAQMNPHFFFNALNSIQAFIYKNDQKQAISYLSKFSKLTRIILKQTNVDEIQLADEINMLTLYLDIETVRFNNSFTYQISYPPELDINNIYIPAMLIQPYVENCIKHGFLTLEKEGFIKLNLNLQDNILEVQVLDNGIGRAKSAYLQKHNPNQSFATEANKKRLEILNQYNKISIQYEDIIDRDQNVCGTSVKIFIPVKFDKK